jgi:hypothetical protein
VSIGRSPFPAIFALAGGNRNKFGHASPVEIAPARASWGWRAKLRAEPRRRPMQVMLLIHSDEAVWGGMSGERQAQLMGAYRAYSEALMAAGVMAGGQRLAPSAQAVSIRLEGGAPLVLDGPYAETREQLGGFYLLEVPDMDAAAQWAAKCPALEHGGIELRPVFG